MATTEKELTLKATAAEAPRLDTQEAEAPSRVTVATAQSLNLTPALKVPAAAEEWRKNYESVVVANVEKYLATMDKKRMKGRADSDTQELGEVTVNNYVGLDVVVFSPIQAINLPPYEPNRIIASGEDAVIFALVFINPAVDVANGFAIPATVQLGGRDIRISLQQLNLSTATAGPNQTIQGTLPAVAPSLLFVAFPFTASDPGVDPDLIEANVTVDIVDPAQPWAAFGTQHVSVDDDPLFQVPGNQLLNNTPMRYMTYRK
jgi:hypothetical protein